MKKPIENKVEDIRFVVWQFVRLMVALERAKATPEKRFYTRWKKVWLDLDAKLSKLHTEEFSKYAAMMMDNDIVLEDITKSERNVLALVLARVISKEHKELARAPFQEKKDLSFEIGELEILIKALS